MSWITLTLNVSPSSKELVDLWLFEQGAGGLEDGLPIVAYFPKEKEQSLRSALESAIQSKEPSFLEGADFKITPVENVNWVDRWKEHYQAQALSDQFFLAPLWDRECKIPDGMTAIRLDPGQAFGTGLHESTRLCIGLLERGLESGKEGLSLLDLGTGSGILLIVAHKLGVRNLLGVDIDAEVIPIAGENLEVNGANGIRLAPGGLEVVNEEFDWLVANLLFEAHEKLLPLYGSFLKPGGKLVLSGLLEAQSADIEKLISEAGFEVLEAPILNEWRAYLIKLSSSGTNA